MDPGQARGAWLLLAMLVGSHLGHRNKPHQKNREENGALALGGRRLSATHNNQLGVGGLGRRDVGEEACGGWNVWEGGVQLLEATNSMQKNIK
jgi:hypothetical protein